MSAIYPWSAGRLKMKNVNIIMRGINVKNAILFVDDKIVKTKYNEFGGQIANIQTEKSSIKIRVESFLELQNPMWFLTNIFFFLISLFGLFDIRPTKDLTIVDYDATFTLIDEGKNNIALTIDSNKGPKVFAETPCQVEEHKNTLEIDEKLRKRRKILTISKIFTFLIAVAIIVTVIFLNN
jgi:hypothetical protein